MVPELISVLWPSRHRQFMAEEAWLQLKLRAAREGMLEFGIAYDPDDPGTGRWARNRGFFTWEAPHRLGWAGHATYTARLAEQCSGEWILSWGDDGLMQTEQWDDIVRACPVGVLHNKAVAGPKLLRGMNPYPVVHRRVWEAVGEVLPSPHQDTWWTDVASEAG
jgi:hypothetical protein